MGRVDDFAPLYPCYFSVHGDYMAPEGGITLKFKQSSRTNDISIENYVTNEVLFNTSHKMFSNTFKLNDAQGNPVCELEATTFNQHRPVLDGKGNRLYKINYSSGFGKQTLTASVSNFLDGKDYPVEMEVWSGTAQMFVNVSGTKQLVAFKGSGGIFKSSYSTKVAEGMDMLLVTVFIVNLMQQDS
ncbi:hypothetical protein BJ742DRAFT_829415 [Cladochytrium replicatum]|nr:hypothetical protein BJ742DRAFT_829415 [Cladochytrium replicatum]